MTRKEDEYNTINDLISGAIQNDLPKSFLTPIITEKQEVI
jgi:hypothetical protein